MKDTYGTVIVDLTPPEEDILKGLNKDARWGLNRAIRERLVVEESNDWEDVYTLYKHLIEEEKVKPAPLESMKSKAHALFLCRLDGKMIAGASLEFIEGRITLQMNVSYKEYQHLQPNNLLYWRCIQWAKEKGYPILDLGGWQINARGHLEGINKFKEKWGKVAYYERDYPFFRAIGRKLIKASPFLFNVYKQLR